MQHVFYKGLPCPAYRQAGGRQGFTRRTAGFTLLEALTVIIIIGILAVIVVVAVFQARSKAHFSRTVDEFHQISAAMELSYVANGAYPPDANRGLPNGAEQYITGGVWPLPVYPGSVFDWDHWTPTQLTYPPFQEVVQISVRFCPAGGALSTCTFPNEPWAANFDVNSAVYYCIKGPCRAHSSQPPTHPAYCVNC
ncbi:MAG: prepilin-type N-terminal cleavage/methylation domain-containing protein [bacterium]|nr:prepilin-type N-terminal cleavage/methylation domain-containing protein [bacterium]